MPLFVIDTSVPADQIPDSLYTDLVKDLSELTGFEVKDLGIRFVAGQKQYLFGSFEPSALCELVSTICISKEENRESTAKLTGTLGKALKIPKERVIIIFTKIDVDNAGRGGILVPYLQA